jgi:hypothetical protein
MRIDKVVLRAALSTLAAIFVLCSFMLLALCFIYPSTMMNVTYDLGMDNASVKYAMRAYNRTGEIYYVAHATETAIGADNDEKIEECGLSFIADEEFSLYCQTRDMQFSQDINGFYGQYVYGQVCLAQYRQDKKIDAVNTAVSALQQGEGYSFPQNNAFVALALTALMQDDAMMVAQVKDKMSVVGENLVEADRANFDALYVMLG